MTVSLSEYCEHVSCVVQTYNKLKKNWKLDERKLMCSCSEASYVCTAAAQFKQMTIDVRTDLFYFPHYHSDDGDRRRSQSLSFWLNNFRCDSLISLKNCYVILWIYIFLFFFVIFSKKKAISFLFWFSILTLCSFPFQLQTFFFTDTNNQFYQRKTSKYCLLYI